MIVTSKEAKLAGIVVNSLVAKDLLPLVLTGAPDNADKCFIQQVKCCCCCCCCCHFHAYVPLTNKQKVLAKTKVYLQIPTEGASKLDGTAVQRVALNKADQRALHADVGILLGICDFIMLLLVVVVIVLLLLLLLLSLSMMLLMLLLFASLRHRSRFRRRRIGPASAAPRRLATPPPLRPHATALDRAGCRRCARHWRYC
jgi:hypothetical protein